MTRMSIIIPCCLQTPRLLDHFCANIRTFRHDAIVRIIVVCNRLSLMSPATLTEILELETGYTVEVLHDRERSVAGAWNRGIELSQAAGCDVHMITALDVKISPSAIDLLLDFERRFQECDLWSSTPTTNPSQDHEEFRDTCDFSCFMLRNSTIHRHGWFDREFAPAYYEDNDYLTRIVLAGGRPTQVLGARHIHQGSLTIQLDSECAMRVADGSRHNQVRFMRKWGPKFDSYPSIRALCLASPFNSGNSLDWWPEKDVAGYSPSGGIDE